MQAHGLVAYRLRIARFTRLGRILPAANLALIALATRGIAAHFDLLLVSLTMRTCTHVPIIPKSYDLDTPRIRTRTNSPRSAGFLSGSAAALVCWGVLLRTAG